MTLTWEATPRILMLEDNPADVKLAKATLASAGVKAHVDDVRTSAQFMEQMQSTAYDVILCDFTLPGWNGLEALRWVRSSGYATPFIYVSGTLGEEIAVQCIKEGATDYVIKGKLGRLPIAVRRALKEEETRAARDHAQRELREAEERLAIAFRSIPAGIAISSAEDGTYLEVNDEFLQMMQYERNQLIGKTAVELGIWEDPSQRTVLLQRLESQQRVHGFEARFRTSTGRVLSVEISADKVQLQGHSCLLTVTRDVTAIKSLERQFLQAQKMEAVGRLAGGVAHDFNNLLMVMGSSAELLLQCGSDFACIEKYSDQIRGAVSKASSLTRQLLAFSRKQMLHATVLNFNNIVEDLLKMLPRLLGEDIEVVRALDPELGNVNADLGQIEQVIMNLAINARDAMPHGGTLTIETTNVDLDSAYAQAYGVKLDPGKYVRISVSDTGIGMSQEVQSHIFEPFFTTKEQGKGTGLGLSTVYGIVKQSGGFIWVYSEVGQGTTFKVYFPRCDRPQAKALEEAMEDIEGTETVFLVEDEPQVRQVTSEYLKSKGFRVLQANNGPHAVQVSNDYEGAIHVLVSDVVMPGFGGVKLARSILETRPTVKVILISGYTDHKLEEELLAGTRFLQKPFPLAVLARTIRSLLGEHRS